MIRIIYRNKEEEEKKKTDMNELNFFSPGMSGTLHEDWRLIQHIYRGYLHHGTGNSPMGEKTRKNVTNFSTKVWTESEETAPHLVIQNDFSPTVLW